MTTSKTTISCCLLPSRKNIRKAVIVIAVVGAILQIISMTTTKLPPTPVPIGPIWRAVYFAVNVLHLLIYLFLLVAQAKRSPYFYFPYLVVEGIALLWMLVLCVVVTVCLLIAKQSWIDEWNKRFPEYHITLEEYRWMCCLGIVFTGLSSAIMAWCYAVIVRAYKFLKEDRRNEAHQLLKEEEH